MSQRTLNQIKTDLSSRITSNEFLPQFIKRSHDLTEFANAIAEFMSVYVKQLEDFEYIYTNYNLLKSYLQSKGMYFTGSESLSDLQTIANQRLKIISLRGTMKMQTEVQRLCNDLGGSSETNIIRYGNAQCGWVIGHTSPCYRNDFDEPNVSYISRRELVVFDIRNRSIFYNRNDLLKILQKYFEPKHIVTIYNFIVSKNLFDQRKITPCYSIDDSGNLSNDNAYCYSDFIPVVEGSTYVGWDGTYTMKYVTFFDFNKNLIAISTYNPVSFTVPRTILIPNSNNIAYVKITCFYISGNINTFQFELGNTPTAYEMFYN